MDKTAELVRAGHYADALKELRANERKWTSEPWIRDTLLAELLERTGSAETARRLAERTLRLPGLASTYRTRCHCVIANVLRDRGKIDDAIDHLQKGISLARASKDIEYLCWAELRLVLALAEGPGLDSATAYVPTLRRDVSRLGDPLVSSALHLFLAQIETKRGLLDTAQEHVRIGRSLLTLHANSWLEGTAAIDAACLAFLFSDLPRVAIEARRALNEATLHGHTAIRRAALANLGHLQLAVGRFAAAEVSLQRALDLSAPMGESRAGITDGLAQVGLGRNDLHQAEEFISDGRQWTPQSPKGLWYYGLWTCLTRGRLLLRQRKPHAAVRLLKEAAAAASDQSDPTLSSSLRLLYAEALVRTGQHGRAAGIIASVAEAGDGASIETVAEIGRVTGHALAALPGGDRGAFAFERAGRILGTVGNRTAQAELLGAYADTVAQRIGAAPVACPPPARLDALPRPPRRVTIRLDGCSPLAPGPEAVGAGVAERAAAVIESGAYPEILGRELMALLRDTGCVRTAALAAGRPGEAPEVLAWWGCSWPDARALAAAPRRRLDLGTWQGRDFGIAVQPPDGIAQLTTLLAAEKLARSARWQEKARRDERERAALWPIEPGADATDAVFLNEEMNGIVASARKVAPTPINVLLTGETGTGKEVLARIIHAASPRAERPFVPFNCTAVPRDMIDSQLFGYRRGAFTGAVADYPGVIRAAAGGTLFLDEIGEVALDVQPKLLRFLESGEIQPLGDARPQRVTDVRVVAATNANLDQLVADGHFRQDLFYRLNVVRFRIPPLRERREEIAPLAEHFLQKAAREFKKGSLRLAEETMEYLVLYQWPGNVRQLANEMRRMAALAEPGAVLMPEHLDGAIAATRRTIPASERQLAATEVVVRLDQPLAAAVEHVERALVQQAINAAGDRLEDAARLLGLSRKGLYLKRQRLGLGRDDGK